MNKSYKTVWNETTRTYVAAPEVAKSRGKKSKCRQILAVALLAAGAGGATGAQAGALDGGAIQSTRDTAVGNGAVAKTSGNNYWASSVRQDGSSAAYANYGSVALGYYANAASDGAGSVAIGDSATASSLSTAIGTAATATGNGAVALGAGSLASGYRSASVGIQSEASGDYSAAFGQTSWADMTFRVNRDRFFRFPLVGA